MRTPSSESVYSPTSFNHELIERRSSVDNTVPHYMTMDQAVSSHSLHTTSGYSHTFGMSLPFVPQLNIANRPSDWPLRDESSRESFICPPSKEDAAKKSIICTSSYHSPPSFDYVPDKAGSQWSPCFLLSLPKELRLEIWKYVLTDPSQDDLVVQILRSSTAPCYKYERPPVPSYHFVFEGRRRSGVHPAILRTNRFIYEEALPILYRSAVFYLRDLEGILPLFLESMSPFARDHIRRIRLDVPTIGLNTEFGSDRSRHFHWAVTCAQISKLCRTLPEVEVCGTFASLDTRVNKRAVLHPLCKMKTKKRFIQNRIFADPRNVATMNSSFQQLLMEAEGELLKSAKIRKERTRAEAEERAKRILAQEEKMKQCPALDLNFRSICGGILANYSTECLRLETENFPRVARPPDHMEEWCRWAEENLKRMEADLSTVSGIKQFEKELQQLSKPSENPYKIPEEMESLLEDWEFLDTESGTSTPRACSASMLSKFSDEEFPDTASTLVGKDDMSNAAECDWELLEHKSSTV